MNIEDGDFLYRYEEIHWSLGVDEYDNPYPGYRLEVVLNKYKIIKKTPKGAWISLYSFDNIPDKFVLLTANKRFACPTIEEAGESFKKRKLRQVRILRSQLKGAEQALEIMNKWNDGHGKNSVVIR